ncbi:Lrp/AsnC ligand binding domain-containing protein [Aestuariivivens sp. NBU2969]|uniref:Lrp/AsnC ligand binding domain-containing protein n=1 Tax=Aestuariivivens sp. NBU2969 TaxID=2873267 RepID=UPI001CBD4FA5|nr:Lrp/AsnC ligand binding domain-containing protein [Aestuariivivens sp. NBU2969]
MPRKAKTITIDGIDKKILRLLMEDARTPILEVARQVGISGAAIHQRLRKLEKAKLILGSKLTVNPEALGFGTRAFVGMYFDKAADAPTIIKLLKRVPEVLECHYTTGNWNVFLKVLCKNNDHLMQLLNTIQDITGVARTETFISLNQDIDRQVKI